jgi:hypothetical protein
MTPARKPPITRSEAKRLVGVMVFRLGRLQESSKRPSGAIPRGVLTAGELDQLLTDYIDVLAFLHPGVADEEQVLTLASAPNGTEH